MLIICTYQDFSIVWFSQPNDLVMSTGIKTRPTLETVQDICESWAWNHIPMHVLKLSFFLNNVIVRFTKSMNRGDKK